MSYTCIELKADDVMPWGKYKGITLRAVYKKDLSFYMSLCARKDSYIISETTQRIIEQDLPTAEHSKLSYSKAKSGKTELKFGDKLTSGPFAGMSLDEIFIQNETYYRYLCQNSNYYISKETFKKLSLGKQIANNVVRDLQKRMKIDSETTSILEHNPGQVIIEPSEKEREKYDSQIEKNIKLCWDNIDPEKDLKNYIGERVTGKFTPKLNRIITKALKKDKYNLQSSLEEIYGTGATFHTDQDRAIAAVLEGKKTLVIQSTGWGKSLVYFLSIKKLREAGNGPAIIISPLIALMRNQIESEAVKKTNLTVKEINSENQDEWNEIYSAIRENEVDAIMIAPEKLNNEKFLKEIQVLLPYISLFVVDEAHCISDWGHDFRVSFRQIVKFVRKCSPDTAILATTATANDRVVRDIKYQLGNDLEVIREDMNRKNFAIDIVRFGNDYGKRCWLLNYLPKLIEGGCGIIYCLTVKDCQRVTSFLLKNGFNAKAYHARLDSIEKQKIEHDFQNDNIDVLVATIAFGMGVDKKNISFVVHYQQPAGVIAYYQQIGRAGRDIRAVPEAKAIMLVGDDDNNTNIYFITHAFPTEIEQSKAIEFVEDNPKCSRQDMMDELR